MKEKDIYCLIAYLLDLRLRLGPFLTPRIYVAILQVIEEILNEFFTQKESDCD